MKYNIPLYRPLLTKSEKKNVNKCLNQNWISSNGSFLKSFEKKFSNFTKIKFCSTTSNGTVALHLALKILNIKKGDQVIVPSFTYIASVNCIKYVGAQPVFCDSDIITGQIDTSKIEKKVTKKTKAIIVPHLYGNVTDMDKINYLKKRYRLFIIEDCAEAIGSYFKKKHVGNFGDVSTFSFFGSKTITTGEGGMICSNNKKLIDNAIKLKGQGLSKNNKKLYYWHDEIGYNYRMTNICGAIGCAQMSKINYVLKKKIKIFKLYKNFLQRDNLRILGTNKNSKSSYWLVCIILKRSNLRSSLMSFLKKSGIETRNTFYLANTMKIHKQKIRDLYSAKILSNNGICLPSFPDLKLSEIKFISYKVNQFLNQNK